MQGWGPWLLTANTDELIKTVEKGVQHLFSGTGNWQTMLFNLLIALGILVIGSQLIRHVQGLVRRLLQARGVKREIQHFTEIAIRVVLYWLLLIFITDRLGGNTSSLITLLGSLGLTVGIALQGSLADLAAGLLLVVLHPIQVGEYVFLGDSEGPLLRVKEIRFFHTSFYNPVNFTIFIRNSMVLGKEIINLSRDPYVALSVKTSIAYKEDVEEARQALIASCSQEPLINKEVPCRVIATNLGDHGVDLSVVVQVQACDYAATKFSMTERIKACLDEAGIEIPFPQLDVHLR